MIIDRIINEHLYYPINAKFKRAFDYIHQAEKSGVSVGRHEVDGNKMYALVEQYSTKLMENGRWEAHRRYIDLQYIVEGAESFGYSNLSRLNQGTYDADKDFLPLNGDGDFVTLHSGDFIILLPEDAHMSGMAIDAPAQVRKIVVKIPVD